MTIELTSWLLSLLLEIQLGLTHRKDPLLLSFFSYRIAEINLCRTTDCLNVSIVCLVVQQQKCLLDTEFVDDSIKLVIDLIQDCIDWYYSSLL